MKQTLAWFWLPLAMGAVFLLIVFCVTAGVDLGIRRDGDRIHIYTANNTFQCLTFEFNNTLATNGWYEYGHGYFARPWVQPSTNVGFWLTVTPDKTFWRAKDCSMP